MASRDDDRDIGPRRARTRHRPGDAAQPELATHPGYLIRLAHQRAVDIFVEEVGPGRLSPRQFAVLLTLAEEGDLSQNELVERIGIDRSTLGELVGRMDARGLVARTRSSADKRSNIVSVTPAGRQELRRTLPAVRRAQERIMAPLEPAERGTTLYILWRLAGFGDDGGHVGQEIAPGFAPSASRGRRKM